MSKGFHTAAKVLFGHDTSRQSPSPSRPTSSASAANMSPRHKMSVKLAMLKKAGDRTLAKIRVKKTKSDILGMQRAMAVKKRMKANRIALLKRCYAALRKTPAERNEKEIMMLVDFTTTNKFFTDKFARIGDPYHRELCRYVQTTKQSHTHTHYSPYVALVLTTFFLLSMFTGACSKEYTGSIATSSVKARLEMNSTLL